MPLRPDVADDIEFLDEIPALPVLVDDALDVVGTEVDDVVQDAVPSLAEQRTTRRKRRGLARDLREGVGGAA